MRHAATPTVRAVGRRSLAVVTRCTGGATPKAVHHACKTQAYRRGTVPSCSSEGESRSVHPHPTVTRTTGVVAALRQRRGLSTCTDVTGLAGRVYVVK